MIYEEVTLEKNWQVGEFLYEKAIIKVKLEPGDTVAEALSAAKSEAVEWFRNNNPHLRQPNIMETALQNAVRPMEIKVENQPREERIKLLTEDMMKCTTLPKPDGLESYRTFALQYEETTLLYNELHEKLIMNKE